MIIAVEREGHVLNVKPMISHFEVFPPRPTINHAIRKVDAQENIVTVSLEYIMIEEWDELGVHLGAIDQSTNA